jgi:hypothetical protein
MTVISSRSRSDSVGTRAVVAGTYAATAAVHDPVERHRVGDNPGASGILGRDADDRRAGGHIAPPVCSDEPTVGSEPS